MNVGDSLYASCSATSFRILKIGKDANGNNCLSIEVEDINDFLEGDEWGEPNLMYAEPEAVVFHDVPYRAVEGHPELVELNTPGTGCYRCTKVFSIRRKDGGA